MSWQAIKLTVRQSKTRVLPEPGPAGKNNGLSVCVIASRCAGFGVKPTSSQSFSIVRDIKTINGFVR